MTTTPEMTSNPPAEKRDDWAHPGDSHVFVHHVHNLMSIGTCMHERCDALDWDTMAEQLQRAANNSWQAKLVRDLPRCPHGRIDGDTCSGWRGPGPFDGGCYGGVSTGNPKLTTGQVFAYGLSAQTNWVMPPRDRRDDPSAWKTE